MTDTPHQYPATLDVHISDPGAVDVARDGSATFTWAASCVYLTPAVVAELVAQEERRRAREAVGRVRNGLYDVAKVIVDPRMTPGDFPGAGA